MIFSILLPTRNGGKYLKNCILSVLEQNYDDYELIIKTFLTTKIAYIPKLGYIQYRNKDGNTTISRNKEIQRLTRIIKNSYDHLIHKKFVESPTILSDLASLRSNTYCQLSSSSHFD